MSKPKKTEIVAIVDRSGSMQTNNYYMEMENGINEFIKDQAKKKGKCKLTLTQFDNEYDIIHDGIDIKDAPKYKLVPRGSTALLDAIGRTINAVQARIKKGWLVVVVIVTDGMENASQEYNLTSVRALVEMMEKEHGWMFVYLGANQDAIAAGHGMGIAHKGSANITMNNVQKAYTMTSSKLADVRSGVAHDMSYSVADRAELEDEDTTPAA